MTGNESVKAASIDLVHAIKDISKDVIRVELQRQLGGLADEERRIVDMWPRFEDGEPVMPGDKVHYVSTYQDETEIEVESITVMDGFFVLCDDECRSNQYEQGQRVKRPVRSVLDADGVEILIGDTVWNINTGNELVVDSFGKNVIETHHPDGRPVTIISRRCLTHTRPDSWERLEEDAGKQPYAYCADRGLYKEGDEYTPYVPTSELFARDIVRRAKRLAGVDE